MAKEFYGIDLGTTYSCIATIDSDDLVTVIPNKKGALTTPSAVYFDDDNKMQVGKAAKAHLADKPENTVVFIKREMSNPDYKVTINGKSYDPVQISSFILRHLVDFANEKRKNEEGKDPINDVVITVPAYFGKMERDRTEAAGKMAGLNVLQLINEPSAAALSYGRKQQSDKNLLVYDLGGGTFDVSILEFKTGIADVLSTRGDHHLGGVDWDKALAEIALKKCGGSNFDSLKESEKGMMLIAAEECKQELSDEDSAVMTFKYKGIQTVEITRQEFEAATMPLMMKTKLLLDEALEAAQMSPSDIDEVILVGGSSKMPMVSKVVRDVLGCTPKLVDPDMAVAKGAALTAAQADKGYVEGAMIMGKDKGSRAYGMQTYVTESNGQSHLCVANLILRNDDQEIHREFDTFQTYQDGQTQVDFHFYESECEDEYMDIDPDLEIKGRKDTISWGKSVPKGTPIKIIIDRDKSGRVKVFAECHGARGEFEIVSPGCGGISMR
jgi:molecular chaperone DnaK (HSP70)